MWTARYFAASLSQTALIGVDTQAADFGQPDGKRVLRGLGIALMPKTSITVASTRCIG